MNRQTIRSKIFHLVLSGVLLFSLGAVAILPQPVSASPGEWALSFDGVDGYIDCGTGPSLHISDAITVEAWVNIGSYTSYPSPVTGFEGPAHLTEFQLRDTYKMQWHSTGGGVYKAILSDSALPFSEWIYIVGTIDSAGNMKLFINGVQQAATETGAPLSQVSLCILAQI